MRRLFIFATMVFVAAFMAAAQKDDALKNRFAEAEAVEKDVRKRFERAEKLLEKAAHRQTTVTEDFDDKSLPASVTHTMEKSYAPKDRSHFVWKTETANGSSQQESIVIKDIQYNRRSNGQWSPGVPRPRPLFRPIILDPRVRILKIESTYTPGTLLDALTTDFYEIKKETKHDAEDDRVDFTIARFWFNSDGTIAKTEFEGWSSDTKTFYRRTSVYKYDPTIKIEAPVKK